jgi:hypothetical protein
MRNPVKKSIHGLLLHCIELEQARFIPLQKKKSARTWPSGAGVENLMWRFGGHPCIWIFRCGVTRERFDGLAVQSKLPKTAKVKNSD